MSPGDLRFDSWPKEGTFIVYLVKAPGSALVEPTWVCDVMNVSVKGAGRVHVLPDAEFTEAFLEKMCPRPYG